MFTEYPRRYVVTGAASGIGQALSRLLAAQGHEVITADLAGTDICADLATPAGRADFAAQVRARANGRLDGVAACAGLGCQEPRAISVNYFGAVATLTGLRTLLAASNTPRAIAITSIAALDPVNDAVVEACLAGDEADALRCAQSDTHAIYSSSKAALVRWARHEAVQLEWAGAGILLNLIAPGLIRTPMTRDILADAALMERLRQTIPAALGRLGEADDIAAPAAYLMSPANSYMTGQIIFIDGGAEAVRRGPGAPLAAPSRLEFGQRGPLRSCTERKTPA